jgi:hypothetical protein
VEGASNCVACVAREGAAVANNTAVELERSVPVVDDGPVHLIAITSAKCRNQSSIP